MTQHSRQDTCFQRTSCGRDQKCAGDPAALTVAKLGTAGGGTCPRRWEVGAALSSLRKGRRQGVTSKTGCPWTLLDLFRFSVLNGGRGQMRKRSSGGEAGTVGGQGGGGGGVGEACGCVYMGRSLWLPGSSCQSAELLQLPAARTGHPLISPADTPALRRDAASGNSRGCGRLEKPGSRWGWGMWGWLGEAVRL